MGMDETRRWRAAMDRAVRLAVRGHGRVEPNPMVGCVVLDAAGACVGWGWHRRLGGPHAEVEALRRAGPRARGGTVIVTLEPCAHHGRTPPCTDAIGSSGASSVVFGSFDPHHEAAGGAARLAEAGLRTVHLPTEATEALNAPFIHRVTTGLPWVCAKWAQTIDGAIATRSGSSRWISSERLRRAVHRERGRTDAIMTGLGTVLADDPLLTPRGVSIRRMPLRVVLDPELEIPLTAALVRSASPGSPVLVAARATAIRSRIERAEALRAAGVRLVELAEGSSELRSLLIALLIEHGVSRVLVEAGGGLVGALSREGLLNECWVIIAPRLAADPMARRPLRGCEPKEVSEMMTRRLLGVWRRGDEMLLCYR